MSTGRDWASDGRRFEELRRRYPRWVIWRGRDTSDYWAMPPRGHPLAQQLISAPTLEDLAQRLAEAERQHGQ